jgi:hypothetical protein
MSSIATHTQVYTTMLPLKNKVNRLLIKKKWNKALRFLSTKAGKAQLFDKAEMNSLVVALMNKPPVDVVKTIILMNPEMAYSVDDLHMRPLHVACRCGASSEVIKVLLEHSTPTATHCDIRNRTPLHYAVEYMCDPLDNIVLEQQEGNGPPRFSGTKKRGIRFIINRSRGSDASFLMSMAQEELQDQIDSIQLLVLAAPMTLWCYDNRGDTPIDILHYSKSEEKHRTPKWERADIAASILRESAVSLYTKEKTAWEVRSEARADDVPSQGCGLCQVPGLDSCSVSITSMPEVDHICYNHMDISVCSDNVGDKAQKVKNIMTSLPEEERITGLHSDAEMDCP